jgi:hypothetical protein
MWVTTLNFGLFEASMDYLLQSGLTTEETSDDTPVGPVLTRNEAAKEAVSVSKEGLKLTKKGQNGYQVVKPKSGFRICFNPSAAYTYRVNRNALCDQKERVSSEQDFAKLSVVVETSQLVRQLSLIQAKYPWRQLERGGTRSGRAAKLTLNLRSPEGVMYYLGEVVRRHLYPEFGFGSRIIQIKVGPSDTLMPDQLCDAPSDGPSKPLTNGFHCDSLFLVDLGTNRSYVSINYNRETYWLHDERGSGLSLLVLDLIKELIALNASAKQLPAASALSVIVNP